jgi:hypothetical protein
MVEVVMCVEFRFPVLFSGIGGLGCLTRKEFCEDMKGMETTAASYRVALQDSVVDSDGLI